MERLPLMKSSLRIVRDRTGGVEIPTDAVVMASTDFVRELLSQFAARGEAVYRDLDTNVYVFDGIPIQPSGELPLRTFLILSRGGPQ